MKEVNKIVENVSLELLITLNVIILVATALITMYMLWRYTTEQRLERKKRDLKNWNEGYRCGLKDAVLTKSQEPVLTKSQARIVLSDPVFNKPIKTSKSQR